MVLHSSSKLLLRLYVVAQKSLFEFVMYAPEAYSGPCQTFTMVLFAKTAENV